MSWRVTIAFAASTDVRSFMLSRRADQHRRCEIRQSDPCRRVTLPPSVRYGGQIANLPYTLYCR